MQIEDAGKVRVLVLGDSGVGKSTLVHRIVYGRSRNDKLKLTNVCDLDVWMYRKEDGQSYYVEFIDVSGSAEFGEIRSVFYRQINGIMLVFDSSNPASYNNLKKWIKEIVDANQQTSIAESLFLKVEELPLICVGTRSSSSDWKSKGHDALVQFGISTILVDSLTPNEFDRNAILSFFDRVIDQRYGKSGSKSSSSSSSSSLSSHQSPIISRNSAPTPYQ